MSFKKKLFPLTVIVALGFGSLGVAYGANITNMHDEMTPPVHRQSSEKPVQESGNVASPASVTITPLKAIDSEAVHMSNTRMGNPRHNQNTMNLRHVEMEQHMNDNQQTMNSNQHMNDNNHMSDNNHMNDNNHMTNADRPKEKSNRHMM